MRHKLLLFLTLVILVIGFAAAFTSYQAADVLSGPSPFAAIFPADAPDCPALCWHGIQLGETTLAEAETRLQNDTTFQRVDYMSENTLRWEYADDSRVSFFASLGENGDWIDQIQVYLPYQVFTVLDAINYWGEPMGLYLLRCNGADVNYAEAEIYFEGGVRVHTTITEPVAPTTGIAEYRLQPDDSIYMLFFFATPPIDTSFFIHWNEFRQWTHEVGGFSGYC